MDMDLFLLNKLSQLKGGGAGGGGEATGYLLSSETASKNPFYSVYATNSRYGYDGLEWDSSLPSGSFSTSAQYGSQNQRDIFFAPAELIDRQSSDKRYNATMENRSANQTSNRLSSGRYRTEDSINQLAHQIRYHDNYGSFGNRIIFLRNPTASTISSTLYWQFSCRYSHSHDGACVIQYTPNNTSLTGTTDVNMSTVWTYTSDTWNNDAGYGFTLQPYQTKAYVLCNTFHYYTGTDNGYHIYENNSFYNFQNLVNNGIETDLKCTAAYLGLRRSDWTGNNTNTDIVNFFKSAGEVYGDHEV